MEKSSSGPTAPSPAKKKGRGKMMAIAAVIIVIIILIPVVYVVTQPSSKSPTPSKPGVLLNADTVPKFVNQITGPPAVLVPTIKTNSTTGKVSYSYTVTAKQTMVQMLPTPYPKTEVFAFGGDAKDAVTGASLGTVYTVPGPTFETLRDVAVDVNWVNGITVPQMFPVDPTLMWANPNNISMTPIANSSYMPAAQYPVPLVVHLHGAEVQSNSDGFPDSWYTNNGIHGSTYNTTAATTANAAVFHYPNQQQATTLWYHDHSLGMTRLNVLAGLVGEYIISDPTDTVAQSLPTGKYDMPLVLQDHIFYDNGTMYYNGSGVNPDIHPNWQPEYFGNVTCVNGLAWPNMNVDQGQYFFRILDASNARFYNMSLSNGMSFTYIMSDGGYMKNPVSLQSLLIAPAERQGILIDFSSLAPGTKVVLRNSANAPYPGGDPIDNNSGVIMQFTVNGNAGQAAKILPQNLNPLLTNAFPNLPAPNNVRNLTLYEVEGNGGPITGLLDGQPWDGAMAQTPKLGTTEDWQLIDVTPDAHPIHIHLIQFQLISRQDIDTNAYKENWTKANGGEPPYMNATVNIDLTKYLLNSPTGPQPYEQGWKDTIVVYPDQVTIVRMRFAPTDYANSTVFSFDATKGPGYVWHCHILDHEDNDMMRPYEVIP